MSMGAKPIYKTTDFSLDRPFFAKFKKHYCSKCNTQYNITYITHYGIKIGSKEAKNKSIRFDFFNTPVDYTFGIFECSKCGFKISINEQFFVENPQKIGRYNVKYGDFRLLDDYYVYLKSLETK